MSFYYNLGMSEDNIYYRSDDEYSEESEYSGESEYEGYDEWYESSKDGGYFLYDVDYLMRIPGYSAFCKDQETKDRYTLNCMWKVLKTEDHEKYHKYIECYKKEHPKEFYKFRRKYGNGDTCLYRNLKK